jgi:hypothetical protein
MEVTRPPDIFRTPAGPIPEPPPPPPEPEDEKEKLLERAFEVIIDRLREELEAPRPNGESIAIEEAVERALACQHEPADMSYEMQYQPFGMEADLGTIGHELRKGSADECFQPLMTLQHDRASREIHIRLCKKCKCLYWEDEWKQSAEA